MKKKFIRNGIVFDPNIIDDPFGFNDDDNQQNKKQYLSGPRKAKRKRYFGI